MAHEQTMVNWLNDAYGLENNLIQVLEHRVKDMKDHPQMQAKVQQHLEQTRHQAEMLRGCIERLGGKTSALKTGIANIMGTFQGMSTEAAPDEMVKNALSDYASEQFEIACYTSLIAGAEAIGDTETAQICRQILREEEDMANWLAQQIPVITKMYLGEQVREHTA